MAFIDADFMLNNEVAKRLYFSYAKDAPIFDYHCHISPQEICDDKKFKSITELWLSGDHYKWRLMRSNGVDEKYITGDAPDYDKFKAFCALMPKLAGNPMYVWCHMELKRFFGYCKPLSEETCDDAWNYLNAGIAAGGFSARSLIKSCNVKMIGTTDDPADSLIYHKLLADDGSFDFCKVRPSFRPDKALHIENDGFRDYLKKLAKASGVRIDSLADLKKALSVRIDYFLLHGMTASDHGLNFMAFKETSDEEAEKIFSKALCGVRIEEPEAVAFISNMLVFLGGEYAKKDVVMQIHYGAQRNVNRTAFEKFGPDTGFDCISTMTASDDLSALLNAMAVRDSLPKTVIYSLNPGDNEMIDSVIGSFQSAGFSGRIQHGCAWWFNDTRDGIERYLRSLASLTVLGNFIGMLTDSRSFLSYVRHDYFRRILCSFIGRLVEEGEYPDDEAMLKKLVLGICFDNAEAYFKRGR